MIKNLQMLAVIKGQQNATVLAITNKDSQSFQAYIMEGNKELS